MELSNSKISWAAILALIVIVALAYVLVSGLFGSPILALLFSVGAGALCTAAIVGKPRWLRRAAVALLLLGLGSLIALFGFIAFFEEV